MATGPLSSLYADSVGTFANLIYPSDLGSPKKGHWITFTVLTPTKGTYTKSAGSTVNVPTNSLQPLSQLFNSGAAIAAGITNALQSQLAGVYSNQLTQYVSWLPTDAEASVWGYISLYTPDTINISQQAQYNAKSLTETLGAAGQVNSLFESDNKWQTAKSIGMEQLSTLTKMQSAADLGLKGMNLALNPQMEVLFTNMDFRTFQFDFLFTPRDKDEAEQVKAIVQAFKFHQAPELDSSGRYFIVPSMFNIKFYFQGEENKQLHRLAPAVLQTVMVDSAPQGWVTHYDGSPVQTRLTLQFQETEIMHKKNIMEKGY